MRFGLMSLLMATQTLPLQAIDFVSDSCPVFIGTPQSKTLEDTSVRVSTCSMSEVKYLQNALVTVQYLCKVGTAIQPMGSTQQLSAKSRPVATSRYSTIKILPACLLSQ